MRKSFVGFPGSIEMTDVSAKNGEFFLTYPKNITFAKNVMNVIVGPSGSGKSTLLRLFLGFQELNTGKRFSTDVSFKSYDLVDGVTYIPQEFYVDNYSSVYGFLGVNHESFKEEDKIRRLMGLDFDFTQPILNNGQNLSGGQRKRLMIAKVLLDPRSEVVVFDEITSGLDYESVRIAYTMINELVEDRCVVIITHDNWYPKDSNIIKLK